MLASKRLDFLLHSDKKAYKQPASKQQQMILTDVDLETTHVSSVEFIPGVFGIAFIVEFDKGVGSLLDRRDGDEVTCTNSRGSHSTLKDHECTINNKE